MSKTTKALLLAALLIPAAALAELRFPSAILASKHPAAESAKGLPVPAGCTAVGHPVEARSTTVTAAPSFLPVQVEIHTPFEPTAFPSGGRNYLIYELHLRNFSSDALDLQGIEVMGADAVAKPLATFEAQQLGSLLFPRGHPMSTEETVRSRHLGSGQGTVAYLCLAFEPGIAVPDNLRHRVLFKDSYADGPAIGTRHTRLRVLSPPVAGPDWIAAGGPGNTSHHRVGLLVIGGKARISRRYAIDWRQIQDGATFSGDPIDVRSYLAYGEHVLAAADATVVAAKDGLPDNIPRTAKGFDTAVPITMETIAGNAVMLDLGEGQFALYAHLAPGSVLVKQGDKVKRGQALGRIGNSGDSREPHLHFEVVNHPDLLAGEGLPYLLDRYQVRSQDAGLDSRVNELPLLEMLIDFEPAAATPN